MKPTELKWPLSHKGFKAYNQAIRGEFKPSPHCRHFAQLYIYGGQGDTYELVNGFGGTKDIDVH